MESLIITAGDLYTDIDVLACAVGYNELLQLQGIGSRVILPGVFNKSITEKINAWDLVYEKRPDKVGQSDFIIVDISEPAHIAKFVDQSKVVKLYDHHFGFEDYWRRKYGENAIIEKVGACATLIWEEFVKLNLSSKISGTSANLISTAIISNTLNFQASVTSNRDIEAYEQLKVFTELPENWIEIYFRDQEEFTMKNPFQTIKEDTITISTELPFPLTIGQLELWNSKEFFRKYLSEAQKALESFGNEHFFLTSPSISEGKNYIYCINSELQSILSNLLNIRFNNNVAETDKLILRKEIKKLLIGYKMNS